jgi:hypothetical protein
MDNLSQWVLHNMHVVFFVYGLSFLVMGIVIFSQPIKDRRYHLANISWLLAMFGITHGINEFLDMLTIIKGRNPIFDPARSGLLIFSFIFLFEFGRQLFIITTPKHELLRGLGTYLNRWISGVIGISILILSISSVHFWETCTILARYFLGFPASLLTGFGFILYYRHEKEALEFLNVKALFSWAALSFIVYGFLSGLIVPKGNFFPSSRFNEAMFLSAVKIPVQVFRTCCAVVVTISISRTFYILNR